MSDVDATPLPEGYASSTVGGVTITSNSATAEQLTEVLSDGKDPVKEAAKTLGEKGGKASAEKRAEHASGSGSADVSDSAQSDGSEGVGGETPEKPLGKPRDDPKARMLEATRKEAEAKRELQAERQERARLAERLAALERGRQEQPQPQPAQRSDDDPEPQEEDFETVAAHAKAVGAWAARQEFKKAREEAEIHTQARQFAEREQAKAKKFNDKIEAIKKSDPDFHKRLSGDVASLTPYFAYAPEELAQLSVDEKKKVYIATKMVYSDYPAEFMLYFSEHEDEFQRIASLQTPEQILEEMAIIRTRFNVQGAATAGTSPKPRISMAPPPVRPVTGAPGATDTEPGPEASYAEHKRYWSNRDKQAIGRR